MLPPMKILPTLAAILVAALSVSHASAQTAVSVTIAPPPLVTYSQPACPVDGYIWTPGYWAYDEDAGEYYWVSGAWVPPPQVGYLWTPGYWGFSNGVYAFNTGYWGPTVGFYGGVNYGYGYGGNGYYGGRWDGGQFRYNTAVSRVNTSVIHNTYVDRTAVNRNVTGSRASYNGPGGVSAKPNAEQLAASRGPHVEPTSQQIEQRQAAVKDSTHRVPAKTGQAGAATSAQTKTGQTAATDANAAHAGTAPSSRGRPAPRMWSQRNIPDGRPPPRRRNPMSARQVRAVTGR